MKISKPKVAETSSSNISKTTHRSCKIFSGVIFLINIFQFMQKRLGVKILAKIFSSFNTYKTWGQKFIHRGDYETLILSLQKKGGQLLGSFKNIPD